MTDFEFSLEARIPIALRELGIEDDKLLQRIIRTEEKVEGIEGNGGRGLVGVNNFIHDGLVVVREPGNEVGFEVSYARKVYGEHPQNRLSGWERMLGLEESVLIERVPLVTLCFNEGRVLSRPTRHIGPSKDYVSPKANIFFPLEP